MQVPATLLGGVLLRFCVVSGVVKVDALKEHVPRGLRFAGVATVSLKALLRKPHRDILKTVEGRCARFEKWWRLPACAHLALSFWLHANQLGESLCGHKFLTCVKRCKYLAIGLKIAFFNHGDHLEVGTKKSRYEMPASSR